MPILYVESSTWCGFFLSWPCVPTPNVHSDIWDCVESYAIHMFLARRQKITFTSNLKLIIFSFHFWYHNHDYSLSRTRNTWSQLGTLILPRVSPWGWPEGLAQTVKWKWCHDVMVKAVVHLWLLPTSIVDMYKVFFHLLMRYVGIWVHPYIVTLPMLGLILAILGDCQVEMMPWCYCWGCRPLQIASHIHSGFI